MCFFSVAKDFSKVALSFWEFIWFDGRGEMNVEIGSDRNNNSISGDDRNCWKMLCDSGKFFTIVHYGISWMPHVRRLLQKTILYRWSFSRWAVLIFGFSGSGVGVTWEVCNIYDLIRTLLRSIAHQGTFGHRQISWYRGLELYILRMSHRQCTICLINTFSRIRIRCTCFFWLWWENIRCKCMILNTSFSFRVAINLSMFEANLGINTSKWWKWHVTSLRRCMPVLQKQQMRMKRILMQRQEGLISYIDYSTFITARSVLFKVRPLLAILNIEDP